jgi:hypothetical protein
MNANYHFIQQVTQNSQISTWLKINKMKELDNYLLSEPCHCHTHTGYIVLSYPSLQIAGWTCIAICDPFCHPVCAASCGIAATSPVFMVSSGL